MSENLDIARQFFADCETGKGWQVCSAYCTPDATFRSQAEPIAAITSLEEYTNWMTGLLSLLPDGSYKLEAMGEDEGRQRVVAFGIFSGTHTGEGGPVPATGQRTNSDYVYSMEFADGKICHMVKVWHAGWAMKELG